MKHALRVSLSRHRYSFLGCLLLVLASAFCAAGSAFKYTFHTSGGGVLYRSVKGNAHANDLVQAVLVDSKGRVFAGTKNGLAVYDGKLWTNRTFELKGQSLSERAVLGLLGISECGPERITEGPPGTVWLGGSGCGVWRFSDGRYDEIKLSPFGHDYLGMATDNAGSLWVVSRKSVHKYDGHSWREVLAPYVERTVHRELPQLYGIVVATNGSVWIGGTVYGTAPELWSHKGAVWVVDKNNQKRGDGPPMAGLYEFDGKSWRAYGPRDGIHLQQRETVIPELDGRGRVAVKTSKGCFVYDSGNWKQVHELELHAGKRWVLRALGTSKPPGYFSELLFSDGERLVQVRPVDQQSGEVFDLAREPIRVLSMAEDRDRDCIWLGTMHGLYRIWHEARRPVDGP